MRFIEILKSVFLGIVEGITEWLPISSTGHMLLVDEFLTLDMSESFKEMYFYVVQLGAILAVVLLFRNKMFPFQFKDKSQPVFRKDVFSTWLKVVVACIPGAVVTLLFDDYIEAHLHTPLVIAIALIFYGIAFIIIEVWNKKRTPKVETLGDISYYTALLIGVSRVAAAEFTFFLAVPVMFGMSAIKIAKFGLHFSAEEAIILAVGTIVAFFVSVAVIKFLMGYIKKHDFTVFGWYRIALGILVILLMCIK